MTVVDKSASARCMRAAGVALIGALLVTGCGGGDSNSTAISSPSPSPTPTPTPTPTTSATCAGLDLLDIQSVSSDQAGASGLVAANAIDDDLGAASRWSASTLPAALTFDLGGQHLIREVGIAWHLGDQRTSSFSLEVSDDGTNFTLLQSSMQSSGDTLSFERYDVTDTMARFVRVAGTGASDGNPLAVVEAALFGCSLGSQSAVSVTEAGSSAALRIADDIQNSSNATAGLRFATDGSGSFRLRANGGYQQGLNDLDSTATGNFGSGNAFTVAGAERSRSAGFLQAEASLKLSESSSIGLAYDGIYGDASQDHAGVVRVTIGF